jgi:hypothetical protein
MSYNQYKHGIPVFKAHALKQLGSIYRAHVGRFIPVEQLKWGEEMEYQVFVLVQGDDGQLRLVLSNRGPELIDLFNTSELAKSAGFVLMPEYGGWQVEAVPSEPYMSIIDPKILLSCEEKLIIRRKIMEEFCRPYNITPLSISNCMMNGTKGGIYIEDEVLRGYVDANAGKLETINNFTLSKFSID